MTKIKNEASVANGNLQVSCVEIVCNNECEKYKIWDVLVENFTRLLPLPFWLLGFSLLIFMNINSLSEQGDLESAKRL